MTFWGWVVIMAIACKRREVKVMATKTDAIENLARRLERMMIVSELKTCKTLEDYQRLTEKYEKLCKADNANA